MQYAKVILDEMSKLRDAHHAMDEERRRLGRRLEKLIETDLVEEVEEMDEEGVKTRRRVVWTVGPVSEILGEAYEAWKKSGITSKVAFELYRQISLQDIWVEYQHS